MDIDKSKWPPGPWSGEPDSLEWKDERTGLKCRIKRNKVLGNLCGYVGVPPGHAFFGWGAEDKIKFQRDLVGPHRIGKDIGIIDAFLFGTGDGGKTGTVPLAFALPAHGGVNYSGSHSTDDGDEPGLWWFGFDCGHAGDVAPALVRYGIDGEYRTIEYVKDQCAKLAFVLRKLERATDLIETPMPEALRGR